MVKPMAIINPMWIAPIRGITRFIKIVIYAIFCPPQSKYENRARYFQPTPPQIIWKSEVIYKKLPTLESKT